MFNSVEFFRFRGEFNDYTKSLKRLGLQAGSDSVAALRALEPDGANANPKHLYDVLHSGSAEERLRLRAAFCTHSRTRE